MFHFHVVCWLCCCCFVLVSSTWEWGEDDTGRFSSKIFYFQKIIREGGRSLGNLMNNCAWILKDRLRKLGTLWKLEKNDLKNFESFKKLIFFLSSQIFSQLNKAQKLGRFCRAYKSSTKFPKKEIQKKSQKSLTHPTLQKMQQHKNISPKPKKKKRKIHVNFPLKN